MSCDVQRRPVSALKVDQVDVAGSGAGMASTELSQLGLRLHRPLGFRQVSNMWSWVGALVKVNTLITFSSTTTIRSLLSLTANTSEQNSSSITIFFFKSSQIPTLFAGALGLSPPPTIAM